MKKELFSSAFIAVLLILSATGCSNGGDNGVDQSVPPGRNEVERLTFCMTADQLLDEGWSEVDATQCGIQINGEWTAITGDDLVFLDNELIGYLVEFGYVVRAHETRCFHNSSNQLQVKLSLCWVAEPTAASPQPDPNNPFANPLPVIAGDVVFQGVECSGSASGFFYADGFPLYLYRTIIFLRRNCCDFDGSVIVSTSRCGP